MENVKAVHLEMDSDLVEQIEVWKHRNLINSRKDAIQWLLRFALAQKPKVEK